MSAKTATQTAKLTRRQRRAQNLRFVAIVVLLFGFGAWGPGLLTVLTPAKKAPIATASPAVTASKPSPSVKAKAKPSPSVNRQLTDAHKWALSMAIIRAIAYAEGTWYPGTKHDPYKFRFTFTTFKSFKTHPTFAGEPIPCGYIPSLGKRECSDASGAGQWMSYTIKPLWNRHKFWYKDKPLFGPENQDLAMKYKMAEIGTWQRLLDGSSIDKNGVFKVDREALHRAYFRSASTWASLPRHESDVLGAYSQGARSVAKIDAMFYSQLEVAKRKYGVK